MADAVSVGRSVSADLTKVWRADQSDVRWHADNLGRKGNGGRSHGPSFHHAASRKPDHQSHAKKGTHIPISVRSEEHTSELQSLMRISEAVFCLQKKTKQSHHL